MHSYIHTYIHTYIYIYILHKCVCVHVYRWFYAQGKQTNITKLCIARKGQGRGADEQSAVMDLSSEGFALAVV